MELCKTYGSKIKTYEIKQKLIKHNLDEAKITMVDSATGREYTIGSILPINFDRYTNNTVYTNDIAKTMEASGSMSLELTNSQLEALNRIFVARKSWKKFMELTK